MPSDSSSKGRKSVRGVGARRRGASGERRAAAPRSSAKRVQSQADEAAMRQAAGHSKIRRDHSSETAEDYVEVIAQLIRHRGEARTVDIARRLGVSHVTVNKTIGRLAREGLVRSEPYRSIFLTEPGQSLATRIEERHQLVLEFLRALGVNDADANADAEGIEHHVSAATLEAMQRMLRESRRPGDTPPRREA